MKHLTERTEIARHINVEDLPTLFIDMTINGRPERFREYDDREQYRVGSDIKVWYTKHNGVDLTTRGHLYHSDGKFYISNSGICLSNSFTEQDLMEMVKWNNVRTVKEDDEVVVVMKRENGMEVRVMKVGKVDGHCMTVCELLDIE